MTTTRPNLGPLTTAFTYPESCRIVIQSCSSCSWGWQGQTCSDNTANARGVQDNPSCWPPRASTVTETNAALRGWGVYSPGLSCPVGYTQMCSATGTSGFTFHWQPEASETAIGCCPIGYTCTYNYESDIAHTCYKIASTGSFPAVQCSSGKSNDFGYIHLPTTVEVTVSSETVTAESGAQELSTQEALVSTSTMSTMILYAPLFELIHQPSDLPATHGLSKGAKAGIGAGVFVAVIAIIFFAVLLFLKKRRNRKLTTISRSAAATDKAAKQGVLADMPHRPNSGDLLIHMSSYQMRVDSSGQNPTHVH